MLKYYKIIHRGGYNVDVAKVGRFMPTTRHQRFVLVCGTLCFSFLCLLALSFLSPVGLARLLGDRMEQTTH